MCCMCEKCCKLTGLLVLVLGVLFLLQDLAVWAFWNISWYTALLLLAGLLTICSSGCKECQTVRKKK